MAVDVITPANMFYSPQALARQKDEADKLLREAKRMEKDKIARGFVWIKEGNTKRLVSPKRAANMYSDKLMDNTIKKQNEHSNRT